MFVNGSELNEQSLQRTFQVGLPTTFRFIWPSGFREEDFFDSFGQAVSEEKIIPKVEKDNGEIVTDQKQILKEVQYFYENLYKNKDEDKGCSLKDIVEGLKGASIRKLTEKKR